MKTIDEVIEFVENDKQCSYFEGERSDIRYKFMQDCNETEYQNMLEHGWRRFGKMHFVPECSNCTKCISMRIDVKNYEFSKSEKRVINKNSNTKVYIQSPSLSIEHLSLYDKYHETMKMKKNWRKKLSNILPVLFVLSSQMMAINNLVVVAQVVMNDNAVPFNNIVAFFGCLAVWVFNSLISEQAWRGVFKKHFLYSISILGLYI